jgi:serine/threonine-protein kinase RsbW
MEPRLSETVVETCFPSRLESTAHLLDWFEQQKPAGLDPLLWIQAQTALVEGFSNAVRHAHAPLDPPPAVAVSLEVTPRHLQLRLRDHGSPFDITPAWSQQEPPPPGPDDPLAHGDLPQLPQREAHWGLVMLAKLRSDFGWTISYDPLPEGGNVLILSRLLT